MRLQEIILKTIDFFYTPFRRLVPIQIFRYGVSGGANMVLDWVLYFLVYNFVFCHQVVHVGPIAISAHIASFIIVFPITLFTGFWLAKYISFKESEIESKIQAIRYVSVVLANILINYLCLKLFVDVCGFYPTPSKMLTTFITVVFSYVMQKFYTFKA